MARAWTRSIVTLAALVTASAVTAQEGYTPPAANLAARTWFQDARFGLFIHWGVYRSWQATASG